MDTIRPILLVIFTALFLFAAYHRLRAHSQTEPIDRSQEGWPIFLSLRLTGFAFLIANLCWFIDPSLVAAFGLPVPPWLQWLGVALVAIAAAWLAWMFHTLGHNLTDTVVTRNNATLVTSGPYRYVRHPMYTGVFLIAFGITLATANFLFVITGSAIFTVMAIRCRKEEANLLEKFGAAYLDYTRRTPRFFPRLPLAG